MRWIVAVIALSSAAACLPQFDDVECYADIDCPNPLVCGADNRCTNATVRDGGVATRDGGVETRDGGFRDGGPPIDAGMRDAGFDVRTSRASIDFGVRPIGCPPAVERVTLENRGVGPVRVDRIGLTNGTSAEYRVTAPAVPFDLTMAMAQLIEVSYGPTNNGLDQGALQISHEGGDVEVMLSGRGETSPQVTDTFTSTAGAIDILYVVDSSPNMSALQQRLAQRVVFQLIALDFEGWDYRIAVTSMDLGMTGAQGRFLGTPAVLTAAMANRQTLLESRLVVGAAGPEEERGFDAVERALSSPLLDNENAGFLRPEAPLLVIYFAADDDDSLVTVAAHTTFLNGLKSATMAPVVTNVITPTATFCTLKGGASGRRGTRFLDLAAMTGGTAIDMCAGNWDDALTTFPAVEPPRTFRLSQAPMPGSIAVTVEGTPVPSGGGTNWTYDAPSRSIVFTQAAAPALGDEIQVMYAPDC